MVLRSPHLAKISAMSDTPRRHIYDRPIGVLAVLLALMVLGGMTLPSMRINLQPEGLTAPLIWVRLSMDTESSSETLEQLTRPTEEILRSLPGVDSVSSNTNKGSVRLSVMPAANVTLTELTTQVSEALDNNRYRLPGNARPRIGTYSESDAPMVAAAFNSGDYNDATFRDVMEHELSPQLLRVPGVAAVTHNLEGEGTLLVAFSPELAAATRTDLGKISSHLTSAQPKSYQIPIVQDGHRGEEIIRLRSDDLTQSQLPELRISPTNQLKEIALVDRLPSNYGHWVNVDGKPGCTISVFPSPDANSYAASKEVVRVLERESKRLGLHYVLQSSTHIQIDAAAAELFSAALWGAGFSVLLLLVFLGRFRLALLVCASLPLSLALALLAIASHNNTMNLFTLMGFLLACGMVVDNAIVVGEALLRARGSSDANERKAALRRAVSGVAMAIIVSTLTTIAMFLPIAVIDNPWVRVLIMSIGEPIVWCLLGSLAVALILVPMVFPWLYRGGLSGNHGRSRGHARWLMACERAYGRLLAWFLLRPFMGLLLILGLAIPGVTGFYLLKETPTTDQEDNRYLGLRVRIRGNPTSAELRSDFAEWERTLSKHQQELAITSVICEWRMDNGSLDLYLDPIDPKRRHENDIEAEVISLLKPTLHIALDAHLQRASSEAVKIPDAARKDDKKDDKKDPKKDSKAVSKGGPKGKGGPRGGGGWGSSSRLQFRLAAPNEEAIDQAWEKLRPVLAEIEGITNPGPLTDPPPTETELVLTREAEERGWRADQLASQVTRFGGTRQLLTMPDGWGLSVGPLESQPRTLPRLLGIDVRQASGDQDRLENLVERREAATQEEIRRRDGLSQRELWMQVDPAHYQEIRDHLPDYLKLADVPPATQIALSWWDERSQSQGRQMTIAKVLATVIIYLLMGILYESVLAPLALMITVPLVFAFVQATFKLTGLPIDNMVGVGSFLLIGVIVNHGVVLIDRIGASVPMQRLARTNRRLPLLAVAAGARRRFTPVVLTSLVTIAGSLPMIFGNGRFNGDSVAGLGASLAIGMSCGMVFTLLVVPLVYRWLAALRFGLLRLWQACSG
jgi:hydrophobic/amphiphilic exporter-1 (mainly G- bacteria), HAE1 family